MSTNFDKLKDHPIASCPLDIPEKKHRKIHLFSDKLVIQTKSKNQVFEIQQLKNISFDKKVMLLPAIFGGIATPLSLIAAFNGIGDPWVLLMVAFAGLLGLYLGLSGQEAIGLHTITGISYFFIFSPHPLLNSFLNLTKSYIQKKDLNEFFRITFNEEEMDEINLNGKVNFPDGRELILPDKSIPEKDIPYSAYLANPYENNLKIKYLLKENNQICPYLYGEINAEYCRFLINS